MTKENQPSRYLKYLPAIFHGPKEPLVGQFLLPFEEALTDFETLLAVIDDYLTPALTPAREEQDFLSWLARWVALSLDQNWEEAKRRRLIGEAVKLYRHRGKAAGLKRYLEIYNERLIPVIRERRWPGGMQIGLSSQLGGIIPDDASLTRIERADRRYPPDNYDYYVVDTVAPANHPYVSEGQPMRLYYRTDRVKRVTVTKETGAERVNLHLLDGRVRRHAPATVVRQDGLVSEQYQLRLEKELESDPVVYRGDTFLIEEVVLPYRFTIDIRVPCTDWDYLFSFEIDPDEGTLPAAFWRELELYGNPPGSDISVIVERKGHRWWKIESRAGDQVQRYLAVRKGIVLNVYTWAGCQDWKEARNPTNVQAIRAIIDEVKPAHTMYYLKLTAAVSKPELQPMQLGVRSTIDVDTTIG